MKKSTERMLAWIFGIFFLSVILAVAIFIPEPRPFPYLVFRIVLALAASGVAAMIPGFLNVEIKPVATAGGAIAVFLIVLYLSPAALPEPLPNGGYFQGREAGIAVGSIARAIDNYRTQHGAYPSSLSDVDVEEQLRNLGKKRISYRPDKTRGYELRFAGQDGKLNTPDDKISDMNGPIPSP